MLTVDIGARYCEGVISEISLAVVPPSKVAQIDFVPQAILKKPVGYFASEMHVPLERGFDDLDWYEGVAFDMNGLFFAVRHYNGHPDDTAAIYLPSSFDNVEQITKIVSHILADLPCLNTTCSGRGLTTRISRCRPLLG